MNEIELHHQLTDEEKHKILMYIHNLAYTFPELLPEVYQELQRGYVAGMEKAQEDVSTMSYALVRAFMQHPSTFKKLVEELQPAMNIAKEKIFTDKAFGGL